MRSKFFAYMENEFELAADEDIIATVNEALEELMGALPAFDDKTKFGVAVVGAKLGVFGDGEINSKEKMLIDRYPGGIRILRKMMTIDGNNIPIFSTKSKSEAPLL